MVIENMEVEIFRGKKAARKRTPISFYNKLITEVTGDNLKVQSKHEKKNCFFLFVVQGELKGFGLTGST